MIYFDSDYMEGAHPEVMHRLVETNLEHTVGYGCDPYTQQAKEAIRVACAAPNALVQFLKGGTQTNATVIDALLRRHEGVLAAETAHINVHESGAIEHSGHKILTLHRYAQHFPFLRPRTRGQDYNNIRAHLCTSFLENIVST